MVFGALQFVLASSVASMMALTFIDVVGRYILSAPVPGAFEITKFLLAITVFAALPLITWRDGHIVVTLFEARNEGRARTIQRAAIMVMSSVSLAIIALLLWREGQTLDETGQVTGYLQWRFAPLVYAMCGLTLVAVVLQIVKLLTAIFGRGTPRDITGIAK